MRGDDKQEKTCKTILNVIQTQNLEILFHLRAIQAAQYLSDKTTKLNEVSKDLMYNLISAN